MLSLKVVVLTDIGKEGESGVEVGVEVETGEDRGSKRGGRNYQEILLTW